MLPWFIEYCSLFNCAYIASFDTLISINEFKSEKNKKIAEKLYEQFEKGNINNILDLFEDEEIINHITYIMSTDFDITDNEKAIEDFLIHQIFHPLTLFGNHFTISDFNSFSNFSRRS